MESFAKQKFLNEAVDDEVLKVINPSVESSRQDELRSPESALGMKVNELIGREAYFPKWEDGASNDVEKEKIRYNEAVDYLYLLAYNSQDESRTPEERQAWADAFTEQSIKIYGKPDRDVAKIIEMGGGDKLLERYQPVLDAVRDYLLTKYKTSFDALGLDGKVEKVTSPEILEYFTKGLDALKSGDPRWSEWQVKMKPDATVLSCESAEKTIYVGDRRPPVEPNKLKGLFAHEVLRHALTAVNGEDLGVMTALPRYIGLEEGFARLYQQSISKDDMQQTMENYADIAWVLGDLDDRKHTRSELVARKLQRKADYGQEVTDKTKTTVVNSANRIFRGTPGSDEISGIFTKDVAYFGGFVPAAEFIKQCLEAGKSIDSVMRFANAAKFDPNDPVQVTFIEKKIIDRYLPGFTPALPPAPQRA